MKWKIEDGVVVGVDADLEIYPTANEVYSATNVIKINGNEYPFLLNDIKFNKLLPLNFKIVLSIEDNIKINLFALKGNKKFPIKVIDNVFIDYVIIENNWYFLEQTISEVSNVINNLSIDINKGFSFGEYIELKKELSQFDLKIDDQVLENINSLKNDEESTKHLGFNGKLFPYQESGVKWLSYMADNKCGCILADSMGLGKTVQIILLLAHLKNTVSNFHGLVIAPVSLLENWRREIIKFYPSLNVHINYGEERINYYKELLDYDVIITSYANAQNGISMYEMINWSVVVLDEAQNIKNPYAKRTKAVKSLKKDVGVAVTGTPFENHLTDVWSITDFVIPKLLGSLPDFNNQYEDDILSAYDIEPTISPIMIRRKVEDVAKDLPEKIEIPQPLNMTLQEAHYYDASLNKIEGLDDLRLDKIQELRMFCTHPEVYDESYIGEDPYTLSQKYQRCCEIIGEIVANNEKAIIFTSFNKMIDILCKDLKERFGIYTNYINGSVDSGERQRIIDEFSSINGSGVLVLNPRAAGTGLNITAANHVIHYNLEWNPAIEDQASARSYRRGQEKTVFVYRLYYLNTIEEVINERIERKRELSDIAIIGNNGELDKEDLAKVLLKTPIKEVR